MSKLMNLLELRAVGYNINSIKNRITFIDARYNVPEPRRSRFWHSYDIKQSKINAKERGQRFAQVLATLRPESTPDTLKAIYWDVNHLVAINQRMKKLMRSKHAAWEPVDDWARNFDNPDNTVKHFLMSRLTLEQLESLEEALQQPLFLLRIAEDGERIGYFRTAEAVMRNRVTVTTMAKVLGKAPEHIPEHVATTIHREWVTHQKAKKAPMTVEFLRLHEVSPDEVQEVYRMHFQAIDSSAKSCMMGKPYARAYAHENNEDYALALGMKGDGIVARTLVNTKKKTYLRLYGIAGEDKNDLALQLGHTLEQDDYEQDDDTLTGLTLAYERENRVPYLDCQRNCEWDNGNLVVDPDGNIECDNTDGGYSGGQRCGCCGDNMNEDEACTVYEDESVCEHCLDHHYTACRDRYGDTVYVHDNSDFVQAYDGTCFLNERAAMAADYVCCSGGDYDGDWFPIDQTFTCEDCGETFRDSDYGSDGMCQDCCEAKASDEDEPDDDDSGSPDEPMVKTEHGTRPLNAPYPVGMLLRLSDNDGGLDDSSHEMIFGVMQDYLPLSNWPYRIIAMQRFIVPTGKVQTEESFFYKFARPATERECAAYQQGTLGSLLEPEQPAVEPTPPFPVGSVLRLGDFERELNDPNDVSIAVLHAYEPDRRFKFRVINVYGEVCGSVNDFMTDFFYAHARLATPEEAEKYANYMASRQGQLPNPPAEVQVDFAIAA